MKIDSNSAIIIGSVEEEYRYIQQITCEQCEFKESFKLNLLWVSKCEGFK